MAYIVFYSISLREIVVERVLVCFKCGEPGHSVSRCYKGGEFNRVNKPQNNKKWYEFHQSRIHNSVECRTKNLRKGNNSVDSANNTSKEKNYEYSFHVTHSSRL